MEIGSYSVIILLHISNCEAKALQSISFTVYFISRWHSSSVNTNTYWASKMYHKTDNWALCLWNDWSSRIMYYLGDLCFRMDTFAFLHKVAQLSSGSPTNHLHPDQLWACTTLWFFFSFFLFIYFFLCCLHCKAI